MAVKNYIFAGTDPAPTETEKRNRQTAREIADEGIVLLKNEGVLPIRRQKIALFGFGARMTVKGGTGSGSVNERHSVTIEEGLAEAGYLITTKDWLDRCERNYHEVYDAWHAAREKDIEGIGISDVSGIMQILAVVGKTPFVYPTGIPISDEDIAAADTDVAIYVVSAVCLLASLAWLIFAERTQSQAESAGQNKMKREIGPFMYPALPGILLCVLMWVLNLANGLGG